MPIMMIMMKMMSLMIFYYSLVPPIVGTGVQAAIPKKLRRRSGLPLVAARRSPSRRAVPVARPSQSQGAATSSR